MWRCADWFYLLGAISAGKQSMRAQLERGNHVSLSFVLLFRMNCNVTFVGWSRFFDKSWFSARAPRTTDSDACSDSDNELRLSESLALLRCSIVVSAHVYWFRATSLRVGMKLDINSLGLHHLPIGLSGSLLSTTDSRGFVAHA